MFYKINECFGASDVYSSFKIDVNGKSTIVDAIEYVFGFPSYNEKSVAVLRKEICNKDYVDTEDCPSTVVKATLTRDGKEVIFERSIDYQEEIHHYLINGQEVRGMKDYKKHLLEQNINFRANNFLVKQNSIESIAIMNEKERCKFFEHSSNSIQYKGEYNKLKGEMIHASQAVDESKKKLICHTIQLKKLEKLSKEVDKYQKLQADLAKVEFEYYFAKLFKIDKDLDETRKNKENMRTKIKVGEKIKKSYVDEIAAIKSALEDNKGESELEELEQKLTRYSIKGIEQQDVLSAQENRIQKMKDNLERAKKNEAACKKTINDLKQQLAEAKRIKDELDESESLTGSIQLDDEKYEEYLRLRNKTDRCTIKERELKDLIQRERDIVNDKIEAYQRKEKLLLDQIKLETSKLDKLKADIARTLEHCNSTNLDVQKYSQKIYELEIYIQNSNAQVNVLNEEINNLNKKIGESKDTVASNRRARLKAEVLHKLKSCFSGVIDRILNLFDITNERYNVAVTKILGKMVDCILVDSSDTALKCIYFLKEQYDGYPFNVVEMYIALDTLKVPDPQHVLAKIKDDETAILATMVIMPSEKADEWGVDNVERALKSLMGNVVICNTDDQALKYARNKRIETVSLNGTLYKKDGVFSGGLVNLLEQSRVWSEKDTENLKNEKKKKVDEIKTLAFEIRNKTDEKYEIEIKLSGLQSRLKYYLQPSLKEQENMMKMYQDELSKLEKELSDHKNTSNIQELKIKLKKIDDKLDEAKEKISAIENENFETFCQKLNIDNIQQYERGDFKKYEERCEKKKKISEHFYRIENQLSYEKSRLTEFKVKKLQAELNKSEKVCQVTKDNKVKFNEKIDKLKGSIESLKRKLQGEQKRKDLKIKEKHLNAVNDDLREWKSYVSSYDVKIVRLEAKKHNLLKDCREKSVDIPLCESTVQKVAMRTKAVINTESERSSNNESQSDSEIQEKDVKIDYSKLPKSIEKLEDIELNPHIKTLKAKLTQISDQIKLIDVYPKMKENYKAKKDEVKQLDTLHNQLINDATEKKRKFDAVKNKRVETFKTFFNSVEDNIDPIIKNLYGSGSAQASILMKNEEEPYLDRIDFHCIIPQKKFGLLKNYSGGEKTMSAIALLLAIYNAKPTSFLIFDEIDAALDYKNIRRIVKYFDQSKATTQIINISHHRQTLEFADALIGIHYLPKENTSYIVHIDLNDYKKTIQPEQYLAHVAQKRIDNLR